MYNIHLSGFANMIESLLDLGDFYRTVVHRLRDGAEIDVKTVRIVTLDDDFWVNR